MQIDERTQPFLRPFYDADIDHQVALDISLKFSSLFKYADICHKPRPNSNYLIHAHTGNLKYRCSWHLAPHIGHESFMQHPSQVLNATRTSLTVVFVE